MAQAEEETKCECNRDTALGIMTALGCTSGGLIMLGAIEANFVSAKFSPKDWILAIYIIVLAFFGILAELRYFKVLRSPIFPVLKFVYGLTNYTVRGTFWFFLGTISWDGWDNMFPMIASVTGCTIGLLYILMNIYWKFPVFIDPQVAKMQAEARLRWERDEAQRKLMSLANTPAVTPGVTPSNAAQQVTAGANAMANSARGPRTATDTFYYDVPSATPKTNPDESPFSRI